MAGSVASEPQFPSISKDGVGRLAVLTGETEITFSIWLGRAEKRRGLLAVMVGEPDQGVGGRPAGGGYARHPPQVHAPLGHLDSHNSVGVVRRSFKRGKEECGCGRGCQLAWRCIPALGGCLWRLDTTVGLSGIGIYIRYIKGGKEWGRACQSLGLSVCQSILPEDDQLS